MINIILSQRKTALITTPSTTKSLIVLFGESNSGGIAPNSSATADELSPRSLKIFNNSTLASFDALDIGTNNLVGHAGLEYAMYNSHGMELELANKYDAGYFTKEMFLLKAGQGGSKVSEWQIGGSYYTTFKQRLNACLSLLNISISDCIFMLSLGINDKGINTPVATYKSGMKTLIQNIKNDFSLTELNLSMMRFEFVTNLAISDYNTAITEVATEESVKSFTTIGLTKIADGYHLDYAGMKSATNAFLNSF